MKVKNVNEAWEYVAKVFPTDYIKSEEFSNRAGYPVYVSTEEGNGDTISDLGTRLEINFKCGKSENVWIVCMEEDTYSDIKVSVIAETGEQREYESYVEYRKDFQFFWSSGKETNGGTKEHFEKMIAALRMVNEDGATMSSHYKGLHTIFTYKKF